MPWCVPAVCTATQLGFSNPGSSLQFLIECERKGYSVMALFTQKLGNFLRTRKFLLSSVIVSLLAWLLLFGLVPLLRLVWLFDWPPCSRYCFATFFADTKILNGKAEKEVRELLSFGRRNGDYEFIDGNITYLTACVSYPGDLSGTQFRVTIQDARVTKVELVGD